MRFVTSVKCCDTPTLIRCLMDAREYFGGLPHSMVADRMKSVLIQMDDGKPVWPLVADFLATIESDVSCLVAQSAHY